MLSRSPVRVARVALAVAEQTLPRYASKYSRHDYTLPQLAACLLVQRFYKLDLRSAEVLLAEHRELRRALRLKKAPDHTTLWRAQRALTPPDFERMLDGTVRLARRAGFLAEPGERGSTVALDSTSLASGWTSRHYFRFKTRGPSAAPGAYRGYPKWSVAVDTDSHLLLAQVADVGPRHDTCEVRPLVVNAQRRRHSRTLLADAGYDSAASHTLCREQHVRPVIRVKLPPTCPGPQRVSHPGRRKLLLHLPRRTYGQRWQAESFFSSHKRRFGDALGGRSERRRAKETLLHGVLHNCALLIAS